MPSSRPSIFSGPNKFYLTSCLVGIPLSVLLLGLYLGLGCSPLGVELFTDTWYLSLLPIALFLSGVISTTTYLGRACELVVTPEIKEASENDPTEIIRSNKYERWLTPIFLLIGLGLGILLEFFSPLIKTVLYSVDLILGGVKWISPMAGLGNRLGMIKDKNDRPECEKYFMQLVAVCLVVLIIGSAIASGGITLPFCLTALSLISGIFSAADYSSKAITRFTPKNSRDQHQQDVVERRPYEYGGATIGVVVGIAVAIMIITATLILTHGIGFIPLIVICSTSIGGIGGWFSRLGRLLDICCPPPLVPVNIGTPAESKDTVDYRLSDSSQPQLLSQVTGPQPSSPTELGSLTSTGSVSTALSPQSQSESKEENNKSPSSSGSANSPVSVPETIPNRSESEGIKEEKGSLEKWRGSKRRALSAASFFLPKNTLSPEESILAITRCHSLPNKIGV